MRLGRALFFASLSAVVPIASIGLGACGTHKVTDAGTDAKSDGVKIDSPASIYPIHPDASCPVTIDMPMLGPEIHVDEDSSIMFTSNPPAGGPHFPIWAHWSTYFGQYQTPIPRGYYIHNQEHGGVVFLYKCSADAGMPDGSFTDAGMSCAERSEAFLWSVANALPTDPSCTPPIRVAVVITPDPDLATPIAAAAWGYTYTSDCMDYASLLDFAKAHYGRGPESSDYVPGHALCADGYYP